MWLHRITLPPLPVKSLIVGSAALMRVSSVILPLSSSGTLKSALTNTFFPETSASVKLATVFLATATFLLIAC